MNTVQCMSPYMTYLWVGTSCMGKFTVPYSTRGDFLEIEAFKARFFSLINGGEYFQSLGIPREGVIFSALLGNPSSVRR